MPSINENLKQLGVTRQTISSYESNRTQPDIETLKRLAEIYDVEFNDILYGKNKMQMKRRIIRLVAISSIANLLICNFIQSVLLWMINTYFIVGTLSDSTRNILNTRITVLNVRNGVEAFSSFFFKLFCIILLGLIIPLERPISIKTKLKYLGIIILGSAITILPWSFFDNIYSIFDYIITAISNIIFAILILILSFIAEYICNKFRRIN